MADTNEALKERFVEAANSILRGEPLKIAKGIDDAQLNAVYSLAFCPGCELRGLRAAQPLSER